MPPSRVPRHHKPARATSWRQLTALRFIRLEWENRRNESHGNKKSSTYIDRYRCRCVGVSSNHRRHDPHDTIACDRCAISGRSVCSGEYFRRIGVEGTVVDVYGERYGAIESNILGVTTYRGICEEKRHYKILISFNSPRCGTGSYLKSTLRLPWYTSDPVECCTCTLRG